MAYMIRDTSKVQQHDNNAGTSNLKTCKNQTSEFNFKKEAFGYTFLNQSAFPVGVSRLQNCTLAAKLPVRLGYRLYYERRIFNEKYV
jgi:hypothetical protein